jgi:peptide/nickel transport system ATP-binding protein
VCGVDVLGASDDERRRLRRAHLGAVFQDPMTSLNPTMRIGPQVAEASGSTTEALALLRAVGIPEPERRLNAFPHELSGGLRQRVMIAMAVAGPPSLVVADEPTTALDVTVQAQILDLIVSLRDQTGTSFLFITHDLAVAKQVADRVVVLYGGRVAETGDASSVLSAPAHPYTQGLLRARVDMQAVRGAELATLAGEPFDTAAELTGCAFGPRCPLHVARCDSAVPVLVNRDAERRVACVRALDPETAAVRSDAPSVAPHESGGESQSRPPADASPVSQPLAEIHRRTVVVRVNDVTKVYRQQRGWSRVALHALRGASLELEQGEAVAVVGESGSGKSTLLRVIAGLIRPDSGTVEIEGARPQMVFQDAGSSLTPWLTVGEMLGERLPRRGLTRADRRDRVAAALASVELPAALARVKPHHLSGGQRQRVAIARALMVPPSVLLCDEPTSALDVSLAATVINLLARLRKELGIALVFVTHDLAVARSVADRISVMYDGRIIEEGTTDVVCEETGHPYTAALLAAVPGSNRRVDRLPLRPLDGEPPSPLTTQLGCPYRARCPIAIERCGYEAQRLLAVEPASERAAPRRSHLVACLAPRGVARTHEGGEAASPPDKRSAIAAGSASSPARVTR